MRRPPLALLGLACAAAAFATPAAANYGYDPLTREFIPYDPFYRQQAYRHFPIADGGVPVSDQLAEEVISLPMHAYLEQSTQDRIIAAARRALGG